MENKLRFEKELQFIQALCNPFYLQHLHSEGYFKDESFMAFLKYLEYWKEEPYNRFIMYPACLEILTLLNNPIFVEKLNDENIYNLLNEQQFNLWKNRK